MINYTPTGSNEGYTGAVMSWSYQIMLILLETVDFNKGFD